MAWRLLLKSMGLFNRRFSVWNMLENWFGRSAKDIRVVGTCNLSHPLLLYIHDSI